MPTVERVRQQVPRRLAVASAPVAVALAAAGAVAYVVMGNPYAHRLTPACMLLSTTGLYCPGCGGTRAVFDLAHGDVATALSMNALVVILVPVVALLWLRWMLRSVGLALRPWRFPSWGGWVIGAVLLGFTVLRNVPALAPLLSP